MADRTPTRFNRLQTGDHVSSTAAGHVEAFGDALISQKIDVTAANTAGNPATFTITGVFDVENIPSWKEMPLKAALEERFGVPASVNNDANAFAVGEHVFGRGRAFHDLVGITLGTGMGTGVIIDLPVIPG